jgi:hypothetical protein
VASIWSGIAFGALCMFPMGVVFLHFYLSTYVIGDAGLYQHRRFSWARFVPWEKIGNVALYQGNLEKKFDIGDIQILDAAGKVLMHWRMLPQPERVLNFIAAARALHNLKD